MSLDLLRSLRFWTALAVCGICLPAVIEGTRLVSFAIAEMQIGPNQDRVAALRSWYDATGMAAAARDPSAMRLTKDDPDGALRAMQQVMDYLAVRPLSPVKWLALAELELSKGEATERVVRAFSMSQLTGPYEGYLMVPRGVMGVLLWEKLGPDGQIATARDLALGDYPESYTRSLRILVGAKPKSTRDAIRFSLLQVEGLTANRLSAIGLD